MQLEHQHGRPYQSSSSSSLPTPHDMIAVEEEDMEGKTARMTEESESQSGYLADCESVQKSMDSSSSSPYCHRKQDRKIVATHSALSEMVILQKNKYPSSWKKHRHHHHHNHHHQRQQLRCREGRLHLPTRGRYRRQHRKIEDYQQSRWIERVYSNTPFVAPTDDYVGILLPSAALSSSSKDEATLVGPLLPSCIRRSTPGISRTTNCPKAAGPAADAVALPRPRLLPRSRYPRHRRRSCGAEPRDGVGSGIDILESLTADNVDDDILASTLLDVVQALLLDSYAVQASYRSYYSNTTNDDVSDIRQRVTTNASSSSTEPTYQPVP